MGLDNRNNWRQAKQLILVAVIKDENVTQYSPHFKIKASESHAAPSAPKTYFHASHECSKLEGFRCEAKIESFCSDSESFWFDFEFNPYYIGSKMSQYIFDLNPLASYKKEKVVGISY